MTDYKPGTVAVATVRGVPNVRVFRIDSSEAMGQRLNAWSSIHKVEFRHVHGDEHVTDVRPLVVLDLIDAADTARTLRRLMPENGMFTAGKLAELAEQIEAQTRPPVETFDAHDGCHDKGWTEADGVRYCNNCGFSEGSRFLKAVRP